jgi:serine/threonine protein phosphatase PrpC
MQRNNDLPQGDYAINQDLENGGQIGICEVIGKRSKQEDAVCFDAGANSKDYTMFDANEKFAVMTAAFLNLQSGFMIPALKDSGSCACVATGWINDNNINVSASYVGDSVAYLVVLDANNQLKSTTACNPALHDLSNNNEVDAIKSGNDRAQDATLKPGQERLAGLAVTRALGDADYDSFGISHKPQIESLSQTYAEGDQAFMIVVCDGAMEHLKSEGVANTYAAELGALVQAQLQNNTKKPAEIAKAIEQNATNQKSGDNISVIVAPLQPGMNPVTAAVFDGHNGNQVSKILGRDFNAEFGKALRMKPEERQQVIQQFDARFQETISKSKGEPVIKSTSDKRQMLMKKNPVRKPVPALDIPVVPVQEKKAESPKADVITPRTVLTELFLSLANAEKLKGEQIKLIRDELRGYIKPSKETNPDDPKEVSRITDVITRIITHKQSYGHLFSGKSDKTLASIKDLMVAIQSKQEPASQQQLVRNISEQISPRKPSLRKE